METLLTTGRADLSIRIIKFDTGDIVSTYNVEGQAVGEVFCIPPYRCTSGLCGL